jgi:hypothetical protein
MMLPGTSCERLVCHLPSQRYHTSRCSRKSSRRLMTEACLSREYRMRNRSQIPQKDLYQPRQKEALMQPRVPAQRKARSFLGFSLYPAPEDCVRTDECGGQRRRARQSGIQSQHKRGGGGGGGGGRGCGLSGSSRWRVDRVDARDAWNQLSLSSFVSHESLVVRLQANGGPSQHAQRSGLFQQMNGFRGGWRRERQQRRQTQRPRMAGSGPQQRSGP